MSSIVNKRTEAHRNLSSVLANYIAGIALSTCALSTTLAFASDDAKRADESNVDRKSVV